MTDPIYIQHAVAGALVKKGRGGLIAPPNPPSSLSATAGDGQVTLNWSASSTPGVTYEVRRVNIATSVWTGSGLSAVITGLNNGTTYNFQVYAVKATGQISSPSNTATATPQGVSEPPVQTGTMFGYNFNSDTTYQTVAGRRSKFGNRTPVIRIYQPNTLSANFGVTTATAVEKRACTSYKAGGGFSSTQLSNGTATATMRAYLEDIPAGWTVWWVYHHEPNSSGGMEVNPTEFVNTYRQMMIAKGQANLAAGTTVYITCNFMAYQVGTSNWSNSWIPPRGTHCDILTWDIYGNPGVNTSASGSNKYGGPATGSAFGTTYPLVDQRCAPMFQATEDTGYADSWGVLEVNTPLRNWDSNEAGRTLWFQDIINLFMNPPMPGAVPPKICLLWEAPSGVNWNQAFGYNDARSIDPDWAYGTIAYTSTKANNSPLWNVWKPYMEGVPAG
jgi:hypothetical protein